MKTLANAQSDPKWLREITSRATEYGLVLGGISAAELPQYYSILAPFINGIELTQYTTWLTSTPPLEIFETLGPAAYQWYLRVIPPDHAIFDSEELSIILAPLRGAKEQQDKKNTLKLVSKMQRSKEILDKIKAWIGSNIKSAREAVEGAEPPDSPPSGSPPPSPDPGENDIEEFLEPLQVRGAPPHTAGLPFTEGSRTPLHPAPTAWRTSPSTSPTPTGGRVRTPSTPEDLDRADLIASITPFLTKLRLPQYSTPVGKATIDYFISNSNRMHRIREELDNRPEEDPILQGILNQLGSKYSDIPPEQREVMLSLLEPVTAEMANLQPPPITEDPPIEAIRSNYRQMVNWFWRAIPPEHRIFEHPSLKQALSTFRQSKRVRPQDTHLVVPHGLPPQAAEEVLVEWFETNLPRAAESPPKPLTPRFDAMAKLKINVIHKLRSRPVLYRQMLDVIQKANPGGEPHPDIPLSYAATPAGLSGYLEAIPVHTPIWRALDGIHQAKLSKPHPSETYAASIPELAFILATTDRTWTKFADPAVSRILKEHNIDVVRQDEAQIYYKLLDTFRYSPDTAQDLRQLLTANSQAGSPGTATRARPKSPPPKTMGLGLSPAPWEGRGPGSTKGRVGSPHYRTSSPTGRGITAPRAVRRTGTPPGPLGSPPSSPSSPTGGGEGEAGDPYKPRPEPPAEPQQATLEYTYPQSDIPTINTIHVYRLQALKKAKKNKAFMQLAEAFAASYLPPDHITTEEQAKAYLATIPDWDPEWILRNGKQLHSLEPPTVEVLQKASLEQLALILTTTKPSWELYEVINTNSESKFTEEYLQSANAKDQFNRFLDILGNPIMEHSIRFNYKAKYDELNTPIPTTGHWPQEFRAALEGAKKQMIEYLPSFIPGTDEYDEMTATFEFAASRSSPEIEREYRSAPGDPGRYFRLLLKTPADSPCLISFLAGFTNNNDNINFDRTSMTKPELITWFFNIPQEITTPLQEIIKKYAPPTFTSLYAQHQHTTEVVKLLDDIPDDSHLWQELRSWKPGDSVPDSPHPPEASDTPIPLVSAQIQAMTDTALDSILRAQHLPAETIPAIKRYGRQQSARMKKAATRFQANKIPPELEAKVQEVIELDELWDLTEEGLATVLVTLSPFIPELETLSDSPLSADPPLELLRAAGPNGLIWWLSTLTEEHAIFQDRQFSGIKKAVTLEPSERLKAITTEIKEDSNKLQFLVQWVEDHIQLWIDPNTNPSQPQFIHLKEQKAAREELIQQAERDKDYLSLAQLLFNGQTPEQFGFSAEWVTTPAGIRALVKSIPYHFPGWTIAKASQTPRVGKTPQHIGHIPRDVNLENFTKGEIAFLLATTNSIWEIFTDPLFTAMTGIDYRTVAKEDERTRYMQFLALLETAELYELIRHFKDLSFANTDESFMQAKTWNPKFAQELIGNRRKIAAQLVKYPVATELYEQFKKQLAPPQAEAFERAHTRLSRYHILIGIPPDYPAWYIPEYNPIQRIGTQASPTGPLNSQQLITWILNDRRWSSQVQALSQELFNKALDPYRSNDQAREFIEPLVQLAPEAAIFARLRSMAPGAPSALSRSMIVSPPPVAGVPK
jgi:arsenate reductase-like glutaredoxin family protein